MQSPLHIHANMNDSDDDQPMVGFQLKDDQPDKSPPDDQLLMDDEDEPGSDDEPLVDFQLKDDLDAEPKRKRVKDDPEAEIADKPAPKKSKPVEEDKSDEDGEDEFDKSEDEAEATLKYERKKERKRKLKEKIKELADKRRKKLKACMTSAECREAYRADHLSEVRQQIQDKQTIMETLVKKLEVLREKRDNEAAVPSDTDHEKLLVIIDTKISEYEKSSNVVSEELSALADEEIRLSAGSIVQSGAPGEDARPKRTRKQPDRFAPDERTCVVMRSCVLGDDTSLELAIASSKRLQKAERAGRIISKRKTNMDAREQQIHDLLKGTSLNEAKRLELNAELDAVACVRKNLLDYDERVEEFVDYMDVIGANMASLAAFDEAANEVAQKMADGARSDLLKAMNTYEKAAEKLATQEESEDEEEPGEAGSVLSDEQKAKIVQKAKEKAKEKAKRREANYDKLSMLLKAKMDAEDRLNRRLQTWQGAVDRAMQYSKEEKRAREAVAFVQDDINVAENARDAARKKLEEHVRIMAEKGEGHVSSDEEEETTDALIAALKAAQRELDTVKDTKFTGPTGIITTADECYDVMDQGTEKFKKSMENLRTDVVLTICVLTTVVRSESLCLSYENAKRKSTEFTDSLENFVKVHGQGRATAELRELLRAQWDAMEALDSELNATVSERTGEREDGGNEPESEFRRMWRMYEDAVERKDTVNRRELRTSIDAYMNRPTDEIERACRIKRRQEWAVSTLHDPSEFDSVVLKQTFAQKFSSKWTLAARVSKISRIIADKHKLLECLGNLLQLGGDEEYKRQSDQEVCTGIRHPRFNEIYSDPYIYDMFAPYIKFHEDEEEVDEPTDNIQQVTPETPNEPDAEVPLTVDSSDEDTESDYSEEGENESEEEDEEEEDEEIDDVYMSAAEEADRELSGSESD